MNPEELARRNIDRQLAACGWIVQDYREMNLSAGLGVAVREFPLATGEADYLLYADARAIGVVEAKPEGHSLTGMLSPRIKSGWSSTRSRIGCRRSSPDVRKSPRH